MQEHFIYPIYTSILAIITVVLVPRKDIKRLAMFGIFFGAVAYIFFLQFISLIGMGKFINFKYFNAFGIPFFPTIAWSIYYILYLYMLPKNKPWSYLFPVVASCYSVFFSNLLQELGIFRWNYGNPILPLILVYGPWHFGATWAYFKIIAQEEKQNKIPKPRFIPLPARKKELSKRKLRYIRYLNKIKKH
ncbi:MAG: hypothetical protein ACOX47_13205 [Bacillota bacterium]|jgi:hypothetical protein